MTFEISEKVVCVDDKLREPLPDGCVMVGLGRTYVVRGTGDAPVHDGPVVYLVGVINPTTDGSEYGYKACRFRRLSDMQLEAAVKQWRGIP
jgi:hypothetical protein